MEREQREALEAELRRRFDAGDLHGTMEAALAGYGSELYGFLVGLARDHDRAADVFGEVCERLWRALPRFRWESSLRVWAYTVARHEFLRSLRTRSRERREVPLSQASRVSAVVAQGRHTTPVYQRTDIKDAFAALRETLAPEDHMLLGLRLDRRMAWNEIARVLEGNAPALRKRYERLKDRLRASVVRAAG